MSELIFPLNPSFVSDIRSIIDQGRKNAYASVNAQMVSTYWMIGRRIVLEEQQGRARAEYGSQLIKNLSKQLTEIYGESLSERSLREYRQFYQCFPDEEIWRTCAPNLTWSHFRTLCREGNEAARLWYMKESAAEGWSVRTLQRNIGSQYYFRLLQAPSQDKVKQEMLQLTDAFQHDNTEFIKSPVVAEFLGLTPNSDFTESDLETSILNHLQHFLMELGKGFAFVARQKHIHTDAGDYFIDLVFYNYILQCFVLIDLKTSQVSHQDVGQMDMYVRMYDELYRKEGHNPTIGLLLCSETSSDIAKYSVLHDSDQLFAAKYLTYLPSQEELQMEIQKQKEIYLLQHDKDED